MKEYRFVRIFSESMSRWYTDNVDELAAEGWEVQTMTHISASNVIVICMAREKPE